MGRIRFPEASAPLLGTGAFNDKYAALRRTVPDRLDGIIRRRIFPGLRFLHAFELNHDEALWRFSFDGHGFVAAYDVVAAGSRNRSRGFFRILLKRGRVGDIDFRDGIARQYLGLLRMNHRCPCCADQRSDEYCEHPFWVCFHGSISPLHLCKQAFTQALYLWPMKPSIFKTSRRTNSLPSVVSKDLHLFRGEEYVVGSIGCALFLPGMRAITAGSGRLAAFRTNALDGSDTRELAVSVTADHCEQQP